MRTFRHVATLLAGVGFAAAAHAAPITSIGTGSTLVTVDSATPGTIVRSTAISGLGAGQSLLGIDARPALGGRVLYGFSNTGQLYAINGFTGAATAIGSPIAIIAQQGTVRTGVDFNPTVDRIRVVNAIGLNLRVNPNDGSVTAYDGTLNTGVVGATGTVVTGPDVFGISEAAYTNNVAGATTTVLYDINGTTGKLSVQDPPNSGITRASGGDLGVTSTAPVGFDISSTGQALATFTNAAGQTSLYSIDLASGRATLIGAFGAGGTFNGLTFTRATFQSSAFSANQLSVANALDRFTGVPSASLLGLFSSLDTAGAGAGQANAFTQLGPNPYAILPDVAFQTNEFVDSTLRRYLRDVRAGGAGSSDPATQQGSGKPIGGFLVGSGRFGQIYQRGDRADVRYNAAGVLGGVDVRLNEKTLIGVTGGYDHSDVRLNANSRNSVVKNYIAGGYATIGLGAFYVDLDGSYGWSRYNLRRTVKFGAFQNDNYARAKSQYYSGTATTGFSFDFSGFEAEVYGGARYAHVTVKRFGENGGVTALSVARQKNVESLQSIAGLRLGADYALFGAHIRPSVRGEWRHEFENDDPRTILASFGPGTGIAGTQIAYRTTPLGQDHAVLGAGLTISGDLPLSLVVDWTGQFYGGYRINAAQVGARLSF